MNLCAVSGVNSNSRFQMCLKSVIQWFQGYRPYLMLMLQRYCTLVRCQNTLTTFLKLRVGSFME